MTPTTTVAQSTASQLPAYRMGAMLIGIGVLHFAAPQSFDTIVPVELPGSQRFYTYASGVAEVATGALVLAPRTRRVGALAAVALYIAVLPGNINMCRLWWDKPLYMKLGALARVPLQIPMIMSALKVRRSAPQG
ncbi:membrane protein [soil metagenome]